MDWLHSRLASPPQAAFCAADADIGTGGEDKPLTRPIRGPDLISSPKKMVSIVFRGRRSGLFPRNGGPKSAAALYRRSA
jgi:hypothetical protein